MRHPLRNNGDSAYLLGGISTWGVLTAYELLEASKRPSLEALSYGCLLKCREGRGAMLRPECLPTLYASLLLLAWDDEVGYGSNLAYDALRVALVK